MKDLAGKTAFVTGDGGIRHTAVSVFSSHLWCRLAKQPSSVSNDTVARACRVSRVAQREPAGLKSVASSFHYQASNGEVATGLVRAQTAPIAVFDGSCSL
jgi:hypothetical protein